MLRLIFSRSKINFISAATECPRLDFRSAIVMGSEGDGLSQLVRKRCDIITSIPMQGHIDSLNVSVATGILLYEYRRRQR